MFLNVNVYNNINGQNRMVQIVPGQTVANALANAGISGDGCVVRVNQQPAELTTTLGEGDRISVTKQGLKGAQMRTFEQLLSSTTTCRVADNALVAEAQKGRDEESKKHLVGVYKSLLAQGDLLSQQTSASVAELGKQLAQAEEYYNKVNYVLAQLREGNPFPFYALSGRKDEAQALCTQMGVAVPDNSSDCWNTSPAPAAPAAS